MLFSTVPGGGFVPGGALWPSPRGRLSETLAPAAAGFG